MPGDYASNIGLASFLQNFGQSLIKNYEYERQKQDELNKANAADVMDLVKRREIMYQPDVASSLPASQKLNINATPTMSDDMGVNTFFKPSMSTMAPVEQPKPQPLTLQQQQELRAMTMAGKEIPERYTNIQPELPPEETLSKVTYKNGEFTKEYDLLAKQKIQIAQDKAKQARGSAKNVDQYLLARRQASKEVASTLEGKMLTTDDVNIAIADRTKEILDEMNGISGSNSTPTPTPKPKDSPKDKQEVERKTKDGRIAIFDATTKNFLRYK